MCSKLHKSTTALYFGILFIFCFMIVPLQAIEDSTQTSPQTTPAADDPLRFVWLSYAVTAQDILHDFYDENAEVSEHALNDLTHGMSADEREKVKAFFNEVKEKYVIGSINELKAYICKRKPCPLPREPDEHRFLIRAFIEPTFRQKLFNHETREQALTQFPGLTAAQRNDWYEILNEVSIKRFEDIGSIFCQSNYWGPCK